MKQGFTIVPFKIDDEHGISEYMGLAKFSSAGIVLEFEKEVLGMVKTGGVREARIPLNDILDVEFAKGFLGAFGSIRVQFKNLGTLEGLPTKAGRLKIKVARANRAAAIESVENIKRYLAAQYEQELPPTTVRQLFGDEAETKKLE